MRKKLSNSLGLLAAAFVLAACASGGPQGSGAPQSGYKNFVVIGIAGDYNSRAQFERVVVSEIRQRGGSAMPYHIAIGGNKPVTKEDVLGVVAENDFDAVLAIRRLDSEVELEYQRSRTEIDATPIGGRLVNLFRSEYTDYTTPESFNLSASATLAIEVYGAESEALVWSFEHQTKSETNLGLLIDETAKTIVRRIERQDLIADSSFS